MLEQLVLFLARRTAHDPATVEEVDQTYPPEAGRLAVVLGWAEYAATRKGPSIVLTIEGRRVALDLEACHTLAPRSDQCPKPAAG